jgi:predicted ribosomally synthesized peptide with nif11-like leader
MSRESLEQFYQRVLENPALQEPLREAPDQESLVRLAVELGRENGYDFTTQEVVAAIEEVRQTREQQEIPQGELVEFAESARYSSN